MQQGRPIAYAYAVANGYVWADFCFGMCSQCNMVVPLYMHMWLPMVTSGQIIFQEMLLMQ